MGSAKFTFKRYEKKYLLSREKYESLRQLLDPHIVPDEYFESTVCSIYYDSDDYHLIRYSIERPVYKEKLRLRSYNVPADGDSVFVELKKKYKGVVYKRRIRMRADEAPDYLNGSIPAPKPSERMLSGAVDHPSCMAFSTSAMPGPWSVSTMTTLSGSTSTLASPPPAWITMLISPSYMAMETRRMADGL